MKRALSMIVIIAIFYLLYQVGVNFLKTNHEVEYSLIVNDVKMNITENYYKEKNDDYYLLKIHYKGISYLIETDNTFNKQERIVKEVKTYEDSVNNINCIYPIYINKKKQTDFICNKDNQLYYYSSLKTKYDLASFVAILDNFEEPKVEVFNATIKENDITIYQQNLLDYEVLLVYNYKNLLDIRNNQKRYTVFAEKDVYQNEYGRLVGKYYVIPRYTKSSFYTMFKVIDLSHGYSEVVETPITLSSNFYINGVVDEKLYFFDPSDKVQYSFDPKTEEFVEVGNVERKCQVYKNGQWQQVSAYEMAEDKITFMDDVSSFEELNYQEIVKYNRYYYIYDTEGNLYKANQEEPTYLVKILTVPNASGFKIVNDMIYYIKDNTIYRFYAGVTAPLVTRKEFQYNKENIYDVYFGE